MDATAWPRPLAYSIGLQYYTPSMSHSFIFCDYKIVSYLYTGDFANYKYKNVLILEIFLIYSKKNRCALISIEIFRITNAS